MPGRNSRTEHVQLTALDLCLRDTFPVARTAPVPVVALELCLHGTLGVWRAGIEANEPRVPGLALLLHLSLDRPKPLPSSPLFLGPRADSTDSLHKDLSSCLRPLYPSIVDP